MTHENKSDNEQLRRWRLLLGGDGADGTGHNLSPEDAKMDDVLEQLYGKKKGKGRRGQGSLGSRLSNRAGRSGRRGGAGQQSTGGQQGGMGSSMPDVARWLGDIRSYFPASVVQIMQKDAIERIGLQHLLSQPPRND